MENGSPEQPYFEIGVQNANTVIAHAWTSAFLDNLYTDVVLFFFSFY